jgi:hypothetical protein
LAAIWVLASTSASGQSRVQFSSQLPSGASGPAPTYGSPLGAPAPGAIPTYAAPSAAPTISAPAPGYTYPQPAPTYTAPIAPGWGGAPAAPFGSAAPGATYGQPPAATLEGTIQAPPPQWDPYGTPGTAAPSLLPQDPNLSGACPPSVPVTFATMTRFLQRISLDYGFVPGGGSAGMGMNDVVLGATFAFPFFYNTQTPVLVTPGFGAHFLSGPDSIVPGPPPPADLPAILYDAWLDAAWNPQLTPWFGGELSFRIGVYSDFTTVTMQSLRYTGTGLAVLTFSPSIKLKAGVMYYDRVHLQLLPAGGFVWTPNPDVRFDILFPNPKFSKRFSTVGTTEWWWYLAGSFPNGGVWTIRRAETAVNAGSIDLVDYNDIRVALGMEFTSLGGLKGYFEGGVTCERQLDYASGLPDNFYLNVTGFLRAGLAY